MEKINKEDNFISAVVYVHNDERTIGDFINMAGAVLGEYFRHFELICINDSSTDGSEAVIRKAALERAWIPRDEIGADRVQAGDGGVDGGGVVILINSGFHQGQERAMIAGMDYASGDFVCEFESPHVDYDPALIIDVYRQCISGHDIASASPKRKPPLSSRLFYALFNKYAKSQYRLVTESFRVISRRALNRVKQMNITIPYRKAIYANCGLPCHNTVYEVMDGVMAGKSGPRRNLAYRQGLALDSLIVFTNIAYRISLTATIIMMGLSIISGFYTLAIFLGGNPVAGWTTTMMLISIGFFGMFGVMSIIIKYLSIAVNLIFRKINYVVGSIERL